MRIQQQPAFVLHARHYSETSLIVEVFTREHGRLGLLAKGARRRSSPWRGLLEPFQPLLLSWSGRGELPIVIHAEPDGAIKLDPATLYCGFYINELIMRLLHRHDPHEALFTHYHSALAALACAAVPEIVLRLFERDLLGEIGYGLVLDHDITDNSPLMPEAHYDYLLDRGPLRLPATELERPPQGIRLRGASLLGLAAGRLDGDAARHEAKALMRAALARHLGDRPLHSRRLYQHMLALRARNQTKPADA